MHIPRITERRRYSEGVDTPVVMPLRLPYWYRDQLRAKAKELNVSQNTLLMDAIRRRYPPTPPAKGGDFPEENT